MRGCKDTSFGRVLLERPAAVLFLFFTPLSKVLSTGPNLVKSEQPGTGVDAPRLPAGQRAPVTYSCQNHMDYAIILSILLSLSITCFPGAGGEAPLIDPPGPLGGDGDGAADSDEHHLLVAPQARAAARLWVYFPPPALEP